jgi:ABC-type polysaccharide/polyol phosphate export permease
MSADFSLFHRFRPSPQDARSFRLAAKEFTEGVLGWHVWFGLGLRDIRIRYQRTIFGPLWITLGTTATFTFMGMLFSAVYKTDVTQFLPYLAGGMVTWTLVASIANDGPQIFIGSQHIIHSLRIPLVVHVLRAVVRNVLIFFHNLLAAAAAYLILGGSPGPQNLLLLVSLPVVFAVISAVALILAIVGARFRDLGPAIGVAVQILFFATPIIWRMEDLPLGRKWWVYLNPGYYMVEIVRAPLMNQAPAPGTLAVALLIAIFLGLASFLLFCVFRKRIAYWL